MTLLVNIRRPTVDWVVNLQHIGAHECASLCVHVFIGKYMYAHD